MLPEDLNGKDGAAIAQELFGQNPEAPSWWSLERLDDKTLEWKDKRLGISWKTKHGFLVALREVSSLADAQAFASKNKIYLLPNGGFYFKNTAEIYIHSTGIPAPEHVVTTDDLYSISTATNLEATVGYSSQLFVRLVGTPLAEINKDAPEPYSVTTLVISQVEKDQVGGAAELALYHLRKQFPGLSLSFWPFTELGNAPRLPEPEQDVSPTKFEDLPNTERTEAIAFYNRALESPPIPGFLYYYRVLESCFDDILGATVDVWRKNTSISNTELLQKIRTIQHKEDTWSLRQVLSKIVNQKDLDEAHHENIIDTATVDVLAREIYLRRNSIAHGRKGQHRKVLVPLGHSFNDESARERAWYQLLKTLAERAIERWIFSK
ncbi:hypothetical protein [Corallococcus llansteffanensis]|uniref:hypothetical protein n=1 Tax=Corallococcus llansteffanensis TaxID=2316731 RepID=UPI0011C3E5FC|nr:hypothetical protein [Corallococcus llansteffanensis]